MSATTYKISVTLNAGGRGKAVNVFYARNVAATQPSDAVVIATLTGWVGSIFSALRPWISNTYTHMETLVQAIDNNGTVIRNVGTGTAAVAGTAVGDPSAGTTAMSMMARTNVPKVRGSKRIAGLIDSGVVGQLLTNAALAALASAVSQWVLGPGAGSQFFPGVHSTTLPGFVNFSGVGVVTNVPGTQVTRKPGRGA